MYDNKLLQHTFHEQEKKMEALLRVSHDSQRAMHEMAQYRVAEHKIIEETLHILLKNNDKVPPAAVDSLVARNKRLRTSIEHIRDEAAKSAEAILLEFLRALDKKPPAKASHHMMTYWARLGVTGNPSADLANCVTYLSTQLVPYTDDNQNGPRC